NGAGKSTLLKAVFGFNDIFSGSVKFNGNDITARSTHRNVADGLLYLPQGNRAFNELTVHENLLLGGYSLRKVEVQSRLEPVFGMFPDLADMKHRPAYTLSGGERQMLAFGRALVLRPKLLMLDEPSVGLSPKLVADVMEKIRDIRDRLGCSVLVVEQKVKQVLNICDRAIAMRMGEIAFMGTPAKAASGARDIFLQ
ncbi:ABC transporter ATP-binding protein, partial [Methanosarcinales archaeon]